ncbi:MAG TPA: 4-hydroxy-tetrahydrodipicolinate synthase [Candidatus Eisenbacteria bacterium]|jgi:4-hydroxy-tetrahydrodipicolinate synthase|nr:4-hydroxy-tetrahydrodipicolinate synthase [Candidatus Eisenbacteria bacterium]
MKDSIFEGLGVALVTPYRKGAVDTDAAAKLAERLIERGVRAIYPCGCTGEATSLTREERSRLIRAVVEAARGKAAVIAGTGTANTDETIEFSKEAIQLGADAVMVITPYSVRPTQEGLIAHYRAVAAAIDRPMVLYNVPARTGSSIAPETVAKLAEHPRIAAIKEASGSVDQTSAIRARCDITVLSGDDSLYLALLAVGARGLVSVAGHLVPAELVELERHFHAGRIGEAEKVHRKLTPLFKALFLETSPAPVKYALARLGLIEGELRLPLVPVRPETGKAVEAAMDAVGLAEPARKSA